jgi:streptogramin lyase
VDELTAPIEGADHREVGGAAVDVVPVGNGRVKRAVYPPGFRWSTHMKPNVEGELCMHAHIGFLARGKIAGEYADGCTFEYAAPGAVVIEPGHDAWVVGDEEAVLIQFDSEEGTARRFGLPEEHGH